MKKILSILAISILVLAGCSSSTNKSEVVTSLSEPVNITMWHAMQGKQLEALTKLTDDFNASQANISVELISQGDYSTLQTKLSAATASNSTPTLSQAYSNWIFEYEKGDYVVDLQPYFENQEIGINKDLYVDAFIEEVMMDESIYGVPFNKSTELLFYNKDVLDANGVKPGSSFEEMFDNAKKLTAVTGKPGVGFDSLPNYFSSSVNKCGFDSWVNENGEIIFNDPCIEEEVKLYQDAVKDGSARIAGEDKYLSGPFGNGDVAMFVGTSAGASFVEKAVNGKFEIGVAPFPGDVAIQQGTNLTVFNSASDEEKYAAFEYMKFMTSDNSTVYWATQTGYLPVTKAGYETDEYKAHTEINDVAKLSSQQVDKMGILVPVFGGSNEIYSVSISEFMSSVLAAKNEIKAELEKLVENSQAIYDRNN
jgi:multiple sugar transport system substrate-binding protein